MDESKQSFPGKSKELHGRWVGISEYIGDKMTYKIITDDTGEEICRSAIRTARDTTMKNLQEDPVELDKNLLSVEDILSPADAISTQIKSGALNDVQSSYFKAPSARKMDADQGSHFQQPSSPTAAPTLAPHATVSSTIENSVAKTHVNQSETTSRISKRS
jgi:hypothetical protein